LAELLLTRHLLDGVPDIGSVADAYDRAARSNPPSDYWNSVRNQLATYREAGDPAAVIDTIEDVLPVRQ
jgi:hypothetical protein